MVQLAPTGSSGVEACAGRRRKSPGERSSPTQEAWPFLWEVTCHIARNQILKGNLLS
jgi:hypothetical protein